MANQILKEKGFAPMFLLVTVTNTFQVNLLQCENVAHDHDYIENPQLILADDKQELRVMKADDFCRKFFNSYCNAGEDICVAERMHLTLLLRSYLHKKKYFEEGGDYHFWTDMKDYFVRNAANTEAEWEKRREIDNRRLRNYLSEREKSTQRGNQPSTS